MLRGIKGETLFSGRATCSPGEQEDPFDAAADRRRGSPFASLSNRRSETQLVSWFGGGGRVGLSGPRLSAVFSSLIPMQIDDRDCVLYNNTKLMGEHGGEGRT